MTARKVVTGVSLIGHPTNPWPVTGALNFSEKSAVFSDRAAGRWASTMSGPDLSAGTDRAHLPTFNKILVANRGCSDVAGAEFDTALKSLASTTKDLMNIRTPRVNAGAVPTSTSSTTLGDLIKAGHFERIRAAYRANKELDKGSVRIAHANRDATTSFVEEFDTKGLLQPGDVLIPQIGALPARVHEDDGQQWVPSHNLTVLRPSSDEYDSYFIAACLNAAVNIDSRGMVPKRHPLTRLTIPELSRDQRAIIAETHRSLNRAQTAARQFEREAEHASDALLNLVFSGK